MKMLRDFANRPTRTKLLFGLGAMLIPIVLLLVLTVTQSAGTVATASAENQGIRWNMPLVRIARDLAEHRDHAVAVAAGHEDERAEMLEHAERVQAAAAILDQLEEDESGGAQEVAGWGVLRTRVMDLVQNENFSGDIAGEHTQVVHEVHDAIRRVASVSGLVLDPEPDSLPLIDAAVVQMPDALESLALARRNFDAVANGDRDAGRLSRLGQEVGIADTRLTSALRDIAEDYAAASPDDTELPAAAQAARERFVDVLQRVKNDSTADQITTDQANQLSEDTELLTEQLAELQDATLARISELLDARVFFAIAAIFAEVIMALACAALGVWLMLWLSRYLSAQVQKANEIFGKVAGGQFDNEIGEQPTDEFGALLRAVDRMQGDLRERLEAERKVAQANARIRQSLDATSANVMVADEGNNIIYMNAAAARLMSASQMAFRRDLPAFDAARLVGANIDSFHRNPAHQRGLLAKLDKTFASDMKIGGLSMRIIANPIIDDAGQRLGTVVEWVDRTLELAVESEVQDLVAEALKGNLDRRVAEDGKSGFFKVLSAGLNELVANMEAVVSQVHEIVTDVNHGKLDRRIVLAGKSGLLVKIGSGINELTAGVEVAVNEVQALVGAANQGDLTARIHVEDKSGLLKKIGTGVNELTHNLAMIVSQVKRAAGEVTRGADEISQGNANLSQRTEEQASSLEETASSMEEMTSTVKQNADNARLADQLATAARAQAMEGGAVVSRAVGAMAEINESSKKIANIIGVIDEIAFQTNLLALNAAVEAARAGEQGRGFAVVATEVRNLAGRSATAAKEIKALIQDSGRKVEEGTTMVAQSGSTLDQIVTAVKKVSDVVSEIAAASNEQSQGIEQVNKAVMQLDTLTQQNAALVEQATAASESMAEQARRLHGSMQRFRVDFEADAAAQEMESAFEAEVASAPVVAQVERRKVTRPWSKPASHAPKAAMRATAPEADVELWKEF